MIFLVQTAIALVVLVGLVLAGRLFDRVLDARHLLPPFVELPKDDRPRR